MANYMLHGTLVVTIHDAEHIVTQDRKTGSAPSIIRKIVETSEEILRLGKGYSQYYATVDLGATRVGRTRVLEGQPKDPVWNETFRIYCAHMVPQVTISIKDAAIVGTTVVGRAKVPAIELLSGRKVEGAYCLYNDHTGEIKRARIRFSLQLYEASHHLHWGKGILDPRNPGVPYCYFPQRKGCRVTLYQDAHMTDNFLPSIYLANGQVYQPTRCWEDMFDAISNARYLIYITGWSVFTEITLCRDPRRVVPGDQGLTLGELLKQKADEGVRVNLLVWDDRTSFSVGGYNQAGKMATKDEETGRYFYRTKVNCYLCPRNASGSMTLLQSGQIGLGFSHHQKTMIVDTPLPSGRRRLVSFLGGLDLCGGRYDTQYHSLFRTLDKEHRDDFHQPCYLGASREFGGPREPWHDIHSRLEGPVAWDVLYNFEQRWLKQAGKTREAFLLPVHELGLYPEPVTLDHDPETWNVQLFRSIDAGAAHGFPESPEQAAAQGLVSGRDNTIDKSIQHAYIDAIRRARNFIYIENQYFMGSSFAWESRQEAGVFNLIPMELVRKIVSKIEAGERFSVYVVIPLYPEGDPPDSAPTQAILDWQRRTIQMMYREIAIALRSKRMFDQHPKDYLSFFCLGNRETRLGDAYVPTKAPVNLHYKAAQDKRRFMVYVHSKMMIVDDEYIIVGSANINERSMDGARDSEIAMGAYQPHHLATHRPAAGQIHGFRMALWFEHMGVLDNVFLQPWSLECVHRVNQRGNEIWHLFTQEEVVDLPGHLMTYPYHIGLDGSLSPLQDTETFPDSNGKVLGGAPSSIIAYAIPDILTT